jgi:hypothetical protein
MEDPNKPARPETDDLESDYANNVFFNGNVWDLKMVFGELSGVRLGVDWHTSITLPWAQAKLMAYYLAINIASYELQHGSIRIPASMIPVDPQTLPDPGGPALVEFVKKLRQKFLEDLDRPPSPPNGA